MDPIKLDIPWGTDAVQSSQQMTTTPAETPTTSSPTAPASPEGVPVQPGAGPLRLDIPAEPMDIAPGSQELADEEREMRKQGEFDFWSNQGGNNVLAGVAQHLVGGTLHGLGSLHYNLGKMLQESLQTPVKAPNGVELPKNPTTFPESIQQEPLTKMGDSASDFLGEKLGDPTSPAAPLANMFGRSLGMFMAPNAAFNYMANMGEMGSALARQAQEAGATPEQIDKEAEVGSALGTLQYGPLEAATAVGKLAQALPFKARAALMAGTMSGTAGALTAASKMVENLSASDFSGYDPERPLMDNVASAGAMGTASGLLTFGLLASLGGTFRASPTNTMAKARWEQIKREYENMTEAERGRFRQEMVRATEDTPEARPFEDVLREVQPDAADVPTVVEGEFRDVTPQVDAGQPPVVRPERVEGQHPLIPAPPQVPAPEAPVPQAPPTPDQMLEDLALGNWEPEAPPAPPPPAPAPPAPVPEQEGLITNLDGPPQVPVAPTPRVARIRPRTPPGVIAAIPNNNLPEHTDRFGLYITAAGRISTYQVGRESEGVLNAYVAPTPHVARGLQTILHSFADNVYGHNSLGIEAYINAYRNAHSNGREIPLATVRRDLEVLPFLRVDDIPVNGLTAEGLPEARQVLRARDHAGRMQTWRGEGEFETLFPEARTRQNLQAIYSAWQRAPEGSVQRTNLESAFHAALESSWQVRRITPTEVRRGIETVRNATEVMDIGIRVGPMPEGMFSLTRRVPRNVLTAEYPTTLHAPYAGRGVYLTQSGRVDEYTVGRENTEISSPYEAPTSQVAQGLRTILRTYTENYREYTRNALERYIRAYLEAHESGHVITPAVLRRDLGLIRIIAPNNIPDVGLTSEGLPEGQHLLRARDYAGRMQTWMGDTGPDAGIPSSSWVIFRNPQLRQNLQALYSAWQRAPEGSIQRTNLENAFKTSIHMREVLEDTHPSAVRRGIQAVRAATEEVDIGVRVGDVADGIFDVTPKPPPPVSEASLTRTTRTGQRIATEGNRPVILRSTLESMIRRPDVRKADKVVIEKILAESPGVEQYPKADILVKLHEALPEYESIVLSEANYDRAKSIVPGLTDEGNYISYGYYGVRSGVQKSDARLHLLFSRQLPESGVNVQPRHFSRQTVAFNRFFDKGAFREVIELQLGNPLSVWKHGAKATAISDHYASLPPEKRSTYLRELMRDAQINGVSAYSPYIQELVQRTGGTPEQILSDIASRMTERRPVDAIFDQAAHRLLIQEALRKARADGMTSVRFPTGGSVALAEGWGSVVVKRAGDAIVFDGDEGAIYDNKLIWKPGPRGRELITNLALKTLKDGEYGIFPRVEEEGDPPDELAVITSYVRDFESLLIKEYGATRQYRESSVIGSLGDEYTTKFPTLEVPVTKGPEETVMFFSGIPIGPMLNNLVRWMGLRRRTILQAQQDVDHFNWWNDKTVTLYTLRKLNPHIPQLERYVQGAEGWNHLRSKWIDRGDSTLREWNKKDGFTQNLAKFLFERDDKSAQLGRRLDPQETAALARVHNLDQDQLDVVARIDSDFTDAIETVRAKSIRDVQRLFAADPVTMGLRVQEVNAAFDAMREHNYFPHARFGKYRVYARATQAMTFGGRQFAQGDLILSEFFESEGDQKDAFSHYRSVLGANATVKGDMIPKELSDINGMPRQMMEVFERDLNLTAAQTKILRELTHKYAPTNSFAKRLMARKNDLGHSMDASRAYAQYMTRFASFIARAEFAPQLADIIKEVKDTVSGMSTVSGANRRVRIHDWLVDHREYLLTPGNELANIRAWTFLWYMAFLPKSMLVNATQIATALFPRLADEYGDAKAGAEIALATRMALRHFRKRTTGWDPRLEAALQQLQEENKLDQSLATQAAAVADGRWMSSLSKNKGGESAAALGGALAFWGGLGFQLMEGFNRRVAAISAWKLEMARSGSDVLAYKAAKAAIDDTQYDYSRLNRPRYMRGPKSVLTVFWQYPHNFMSGLMGVHGYGTAARMWAILLASAGALGLPGADWATGMADFLRNRMGVGTPGSTKADFHKWIRDEVGSHVQLIHDHPDLVAHGASRYGFGIPWLMQRAGIPAPVVDLSGSMSMGQWPPGAEILSAKDSKDFLAKFSTSIGGASLNIPAAGVNALYSDDPSLLKRLEMASPNIVRSLLRGGRYAVQGTETNSLGDPLMGMTPEDRITRSEALATAMGFGLQRLNENRELSFLAREQVRYMTLRKSMLVQDYARARTPEESDLAYKEVIKFNNMVSDMGYETLAIRGEDIRRKASRDSTRKAMAEVGLPAQRNAIPVFQDIRGTEPMTPQTPPAPAAAPAPQKPIVLFETPVKPPSGK